MSELAIVITEGTYRIGNAKVAHGLVRGSDRFKVAAIVDSTCAGEDAGELLDGQHRDIPITATIDAAIARCPSPPRYCVIGLATHGGRLTPVVRDLARIALTHGLSVVNGLHDLVSADPELVAIARETHAELIDLRRPPSTRDLHFWTGAIKHVKAPRVAVLGTDCAVGKRTTARLVVESLNHARIRAEMIYTGQTGWMQGGRYGFILDSVPNDYVSGEMEHAIMRCEEERHPDVMIIEGQSSLRNPSGPCGAELLLSGGAHAVILQHAPERTFFDGFEHDGYRVPPVEEEVRLISLYGARTLAISLQGHDPSPAQRHYRDALEDALGIPVVFPLAEGMERIRDLVRDHIDEAPGK